MAVFLGKGYALWRGVVGPCPGCPEGGGEGGRGWRGLHSAPYHLPFLEKELGTFASAEWLLGPGPSLLMIPLVPGLPYPCLSLVVVLSRCSRQGQLKIAIRERYTTCLFICQNSY
jgi:hypothetical protein